MPGSLESGRHVPAMGSWMRWPLYIPPSSAALGGSLEPCCEFDKRRVLWGPWLSPSQSNPLLSGSTQCPLPGHLLQDALQADTSCVQPADLGSLRWVLQTHPLSDPRADGGWGGVSHTSFVFTGLLCGVIFWYLKSDMVFPVFLEG